jgi:hypothetical protein
MRRLFVVGIGMFLLLLVGCGQDIKEFRTEVNFKSSHSGWCYQFVLTELRIDEKWDNRLEPLAFAVRVQCPTTMSQQ